MGRQRYSPWYDSSQVFSDTQRVDLFDDPAWETAPPLTPTRTAVMGAGAPSWWVVVKAAVGGRALAKRGQHSHKLA